MGQWKAGSNCLCCLVEFITIFCNSGNMIYHRLVEPQHHECVIEICLLGLTQGLSIYGTNCINILEDFFSDFSVFHFAEYSF